MAKTVMTCTQTPAQYRETFFERLRAIRITSGYTQEAFAEMLGISRDTYAKYESRSLLPHRLISTVAEITGHDSRFILSGYHSSDPDMGDGMGI